MTSKSKPAQSMRYVGEGEFVIGVPARDLSADEWSALTDDQREAAKNLYTAETPTTEEG